MGNRIFCEHSFHSLGQMDEKLKLVLHLTVGQVQLKIYVYALVNILAKKAVLFPTPAVKDTCFLPQFFSRAGANLG